jgi:flagellin FlaB
MFDTENEQERGQVGIGTLIVFIALVLVAAIAAGVLINTAGFLQSQAEATGEESTSQVSDTVQVLSATGDVDSGSTPAVTAVDLRVSLAPGADAVDLSNAEMQLVGPGGTETVTAPTVSTGDNTLTDSSDRSTITIQQATLEAVSSGGGTNNGLDEGDEVDVTLTAASGGQTSTALVVPTPIDGDSGGATEL